MKDYRGTEIKNPGSSPASYLGEEIPGQQNTNIRFL